MKLINALLTFALCVMSSALALLAIPPAIAAAALLCSAQWFREISFPDRP